MKTGSSRSEMLADVVLAGEVVLHTGRGSGARSGAAAFLDLQQGADVVCGEELFGCGQVGFGHGFPLVLCPVSGGPAFGGFDSGCPVLRWSGEPAEPVFPEGVAVGAEQAAQRCLADRLAAVVRIGENGAGGLDELLVPRARRRAGRTCQSAGRVAVYREQAQGQAVFERGAPPPQPSAIGSLQARDGVQPLVFEGQAVVVAGDVPEDHATGDQRGGTWCEQPAGCRDPLDPGAGGQAHCLMRCRTPSTTVTNRIGIAACITAATAAP